MEKLDNGNMESLTDKDQNNAISPEKKKKRLMIIIIVVSCIVVVTVVVVLCVVLTRKKYDENNLYGCMCDAGSSSTRVSVYHWPKRVTNNIPVISEKGRTSTSPGMHTKNDNEIKEAMSILINYCRDKVNEVSDKKANLSDVNFYLKATAGMRSISVEEQNKKLDVIRKSIRESELKFLKDDWAKVITGIEEGTFGWITGNYLNKVLFDNEKAGKIDVLPYGSIDLGGYSLEITFYTNETIKEHSANLSMSNLMYPLYSYSFQNYGQDKFNEALMKSFIDSSEPNSTIIKFPCYLNGYNMSKVFDGINYTFVGEVNIEICKKSIRNLMHINDEKEKSMNDIYQPKIPDNMTFYGISGLYWIAHFYDMDDDEFHAPSEFLNITEEFCKKNWEDAKKEYKSKVEEVHLKDYCISGFYVYYFLAEGFKIDKDKKLIKYPEKINGVEVSWTLGAMTYEIGLQPFKDAKLYIEY